MTKWGGVENRIIFRVGRQPFWLTTLVFNSLIGLGARQNK